MNGCDLEMEMSHGDNVKYSFCICRTKKHFSKNAQENASLKQVDHKL